MSAKMSLDALAREQLELAAAASSGRSAATVFGGHQNAIPPARHSLAALEDSAVLLTVGMTG